MPMLEWTGERFLPWHLDPALAYEHLHRYFYAAQFVKGKTVLDLASGEGYGSNLLARYAEKVVGIDIDPAAIKHAATRYFQNNLTFQVGSITKVPLEDVTFDMVVCFEAIEHIEDHESLLSEIRRLLKPDGVLVTSTPNKTVYDAHLEEKNEFHVKELEFEEFRGLLEARFKHVRFLGQRIYSHSDLWPIADAPDLPPVEFDIQRANSEFETISRQRRIPLYYVAVASNSSHLEDFPASTLVDIDNELLRSMSDAVKWREEQITVLKTGLKWREEQVERLEKDVSWMVSVMNDLKKAHASDQEALAWRAEQVEYFEKETATLTSQLHKTQHQLNQSNEQLAAIHESSGWKFILRLRHFRDRLMPEGSSRRRLFEKLVKSS
jgi:O-antigen biosynthesis protein